MDKNMNRLLHGVVIVIFSFCLANGLILARFDTAIAQDIAPPALRIKAPPELTPLPDTNVYVITDIDTDVAFYRGWWWRSHEGGWYRARDYNGAWGLVIARKVPKIILTLPPGFRNNGLVGTRIPYGQLKKNWQKWEDEKRWNKDKSENKSKDKKKIEQKKKQSNKEQSKPEFERKEHGRGDSGGARGKGKQ